MKKDAKTVLRNLDLQQVMAFFAVTECGSFTKAAEELHISQASVSRVIARLEQETNLILFVRKARESVLTPAGRILYREWKAAFRQMETSYLAAWETQKGYIHTLNIGCVEMKQDVSHHIALLNYMEKNCPTYAVRVECQRTEQLSERLIAGELDFILVNSFESRYLEALGVHRIPLFQSECSVYIHKAHPLYRKKEIVPGDFAARDFTVFGTDHVLASPILQDFCRKTGLTFRNLYMESDFEQAAVSFARKTGLFLSEGFFEEGQLGPVRRVPIQDMYSGMTLAWREQRMREMVKIFQDFAGQIRRSSD